MTKLLTSPQASDEHMRFSALADSPPGRLIAMFTRTAYPPARSTADAFHVVLTQPRETAQAVTKPCSCGHSKNAHEHYRSGTDCSGCSCERYARRRRGLDMLRIHL